MNSEPILAFLLAFLTAVLLGSPLIAALKRVGARQTVSTDAPATHQKKQGTPTMGGLLILAGLAVPVLWYAATHPAAGAFPLLGMTLAFGAIGFLDDYLIATRGKNLGVTSRQKLLLQFVFAIAFVLWLRVHAAPGETTVLRLAPGSTSGVDLGLFYYALATVFIVGMSNGINLTDGLDGLAGGVTLLIALGLAAVGGWVTIFGVALAGGCAGFLWYNAHPAQVFMGNTGSSALGAALAGLAVMGKAEVPFQVFALVPYLVTASVMIQVSVFKYRRRRHGIEYARANRVFRRTPLHHHFEELGWAETKIVQRFWLATAVTVAAGLLLR